MNYDGDVMSDMISSASGSPGYDDPSVLVSPDGNYEYEAAHGTVQRHYYKHLKGEETLHQPVANHLCFPDRRTGQARRAGRQKRAGWNLLTGWKRPPIDTIENGDDKRPGSDYHHSKSSCT